MTVARSREPHDLGHALDPETCAHSKRDIESCVICGKTLDWPREHVDTCGEHCFRGLMRRQRERRQPRCFFGD